MTKRKATAKSKNLDAKAQRKNAKGRHGVQGEQD
jgi:hypothetical protein